MNTKKWGVHGWVFLHTIAYNYNFNRKITEKNIDKYSQFFHSLGNVLPCRYCRQSYKSFIHQVPIEPYLRNGKLVEWVYIIHNLVNDKLRKQGHILEPNPSIDDVFNKYETYRANNCSTGSCVIVKKVNYDRKPYQKIRYASYNHNLSCNK